MNSSLRIRTVLAVFLTAGVFIFFSSVPVLYAESSTRYIRTGPDGNVLIETGSTGLTTAIVIASSPDLPRGIAFFESKHFSPLTFDPGEIEEDKTQASFFVKFDPRGQPAQLVIKKQSYSIRGGFTLVVAQDSTRGNNSSIFTFDEKFNYISLTRKEQAIVGILAPSLKVILNATGPAVALAADPRSEVFGHYELKDNRLFLGDRLIRPGSNIGITIRGKKPFCLKDSVKYIREDILYLLKSASNSRQRREILRRELINNSRYREDIIPINADKNGVIAFNPKLDTIQQISRLSQTARKTCLIKDLDLELE